MAIEKPVIGQNNWGDELNAALDSVDERLIALETVVDEFIPLPDFLTYAEGREHLPTLNTNFGWDDQGAWFGNAQEGASYPIFTSFTIPTNAKVQVEFDVEIDSYCSDAGVCIYVNGTTPEWDYDTSPNRIAAQFDCPNIQIQGIENSSSSEGESGIPDSGVYRMVLVYDPEDTTDNVVFRVMTTGESPTLVDEISLTETLPTGAYRVGFAADFSSGEGDDGDTKTYISNLSISINNGTTLYEDTLQEGNSGTSTALVVPLDIKDSSGNPLITFEKSYTGTARIVTPQDDLALKSARDILLYAGEDGLGNVYIGWGDADMTPDANNRVATIGDIESGTTGDITFDGVQIIGAGEASGDGLDNGTIELVPDADLYAGDQYLVVDPTGPNHIHIRAGGEQDGSSAELIFGGEKTNLKVSDNNGTIKISTSYENNVIQLSNEGVTTSSTFVTTVNGELHNVIGEGWTVKNSTGNTTVELTGSTSPEPGEVTFTVAEEDFFVPDDSYQFFPPASNFDGDIQWEFAPNGAIYGPAMGGVRVPAIANVQAGEDLFVYANRAELVLGADKNVIVSSDDSDIILNADGGEYLRNADSPENQIATIGDLGEDTSFTVAGGTLDNQPTFTGAPLFTGSYVKTGPMVHFRIDVDMDNITSFGTGQYYLDLPFPAKYNYLFRNACLHDISMPRQYGLSGHVGAGQSRMLLFYTDTSGQDYAFDYNSPALLTVNDNFHISGDYIADDTV